MWIFLTNACLSVVAHREKPDVLLVRSRIKGDIEACFPEAHVEENTGSDYRYRALIQRTRVGELLRSVADDIRYDNFKGAVALRDDDRADLYSDIYWVVLEGAHTIDRNKKS